MSLPSPGKCAANAGRGRSGNRSTASVIFCGSLGLREGLLRELGNVIIQSGFSLLRQRMSAVETGVQLWLRVSGREERLLELEERLGSHPLVLSFESEYQVGAAQAPPAPAPRPAIPKRPPQGVGRSLQGSGAGPAVGQIEAELPGLAVSDEWLVISGQQKAGNIPGLFCVWWMPLIAYHPTVTDH